MHDEAIRNLLTNQPNGSEVGESPSKRDPVDRLNERVTELEVKAQAHTKGIHALDALLNQQIERVESRVSVLDVEIGRLSATSANSDRLKVIEQKIRKNNNNCQQEFDSIHSRLSSLAVGGLGITINHGDGGPHQRDRSATPSTTTTSQFEQLLDGFGVQVGQVRKAMQRVSTELENLELHMDSVQGQPPTLGPVANSKHHSQHSQDSGLGQVPSLFSCIAELEGVSQQFVTALDKLDEQHSQLSTPHSKGSSKRGKHHTTDTQYSNSDWVVREVPSLADRIGRACYRIGRVLHVLLFRWRRLWQVLSDTGAAGMQPGGVASPPPLVGIHAYPGRQHHPSPQHSSPHKMQHSQPNRGPLSPSDLSSSALSSDHSEDLLSPSSPYHLSPPPLSPGQQPQSPQQFSDLLAALLPSLLGSTVQQQPAGFPQQSGHHRRHHSGYDSVTTVEEDATATVAYHA
eukprot:TRINITY_DN33518_c0_g1_i1.p1 TRINITY_DN33518_c0_g1~~TRINITY_DN33518_c0_g1_i1.p1  ORF type:complete len:505 (-),score=27.03 TRINITY_DN33518_c0_g1_i1:1248-2621(-)